MPRTWTDQPRRVRDLPLLYTIRLRDDIAEVRADVGDSPTFFLTIGNLFRSETVRCPNAQAVLDVLARVTHRVEGQPIDLPAWVSVMPNGRRRDDD